MSAQSLLKPAAEAQRVATLRSYRVIDSPPSTEFDNIVRLAADIFRAPMALISLVDENRQVFKARIGLNVCDTPREVSFCSNLLQGDDVLVVPDACHDPRFADNPLVKGAPFIRFYAGASLRSPEGHRIGSICIIDRKVRKALSERQKKVLRDLAGITMDHMNRLRLEDHKRASLQFAAAIPDAIVCTEGDGGLITFWNAAAEQMFGLSQAEALSEPIGTIVADEYRSVFLNRMARLHAGGKDRPTGAVEIAGLRRDGTAFPMEVSLAACGDNLQTGTFIRDITERRAAQESLRFLTHFDRLTSLPNRVRFLQQIDETLRKGERFAVLKVGFDKFKSINGSMGMAAGDAVLRIAADRIKAVAKAGDFVARLGSDEFGLLRLGSDDAREATALAHQVLGVLSAPFILQGAKCHLSTSIGLVLSPSHAAFDNADAVLKSGLLALSHAKKGGGRRAECFHPDFGRQANENHVIEEQLREALDRKQFELHYQPQVHMPDRSIVGAEALLRWRHPTRGLLQPADFLMVLEASAIASEVGRWAMTTACAFAAQMASAGMSMNIGVNLFASQLREPRFHTDVTDALSSTKLPAERLELEITETTLLGLDSSVIDPLRWLRNLGVRIAFDDYGTGFASLSLLKRYPVTRLKIDRGFVRGLETDPEAAAIVKAVLVLGAGLGLEVIAEGIETVEQSAALMGIGCREAQGYLFGKPMTATHFERLMKNNDLRDARAGG